MDWATISSVMTEARTEGRGGLCALHDRALADQPCEFGILGRVLTARNFDPTLQRYIASILSVVLNVVLVVAIPLVSCGIETNQLRRAAGPVSGFAVGAAWSGLLGNFGQPVRSWSSSGLTRWVITSWEAGWKAP